MPPLSFLVVTFILAACLSFSQRVLAKEVSVHDPLRVMGLNPPFYQFWTYQPPTDAEVKRAYRLRSLELHPDKRSQQGQKHDANEEFLRLTDAYNYLKGNSLEARQRRASASRRYAAHGQTLQFVIDTVRGCAQYPYTLLLHFSSQLKRQVTAHWKRFQRQPFKYMTVAFRDFYSSLTLQKVLWILFQLWILRNVLGFLCFLFMKYVVNPWRLRFGSFNSRSSIAARESIPMHRDSATRPDSDWRVEQHQHSGDESTARVTRSTRRRESTVTPLVGGEHVSSSTNARTNSTSSSERIARQRKRIATGSQAAYLQTKQQLDAVRELRRQQYDERMNHQHS